jgi:hypothetical protein
MRLVGLKWIWNLTDKPRSERHITYGNFSAFVKPRVTRLDENHMCPSRLSPLSAPSNLWKSIPPKLSAVAVEAEILLLARYM